MPARGPQPAARLCAAAHITAGLLQPPAAAPRLAPLLGALLTHAPHTPPPPSRSDEDAEPRGAHLGQPRQPRAGAARGCRQPRLARAGAGPALLRACPEACSRPGRQRCACLGCARVAAFPGLRLQAECTTTPAAQLPDPCSPQGQAYIKAGAHAWAVASISSSAAAISACRLPHPTLPAQGQAYIKVEAAVTQPERRQRCASGAVLQAPRCPGGTAPRKPPPLGRLGRAAAHAGPSCRPPHPPPALPPTHPPLHPHVQHRHKLVRSHLLFRP